MSHQQPWLSDILRLTASDGHHKETAMLDPEPWEHRRKADDSVAALEADMAQRLPITSDRYPKRKTMLKTQLVDGLFLSLWDEYETIEAALLDVRTHWPEDPANVSCVLVHDEKGRVLATCLRDECDQELCITTLAGGVVEYHRCFYILDADTGDYQRTEIMPVDRAGVMVCGK